jgi:serine/threonine-protein kinase
MLTNGKRLDGRYDIREQIGGGGFGAVFLAEDTRFSGKNLVAIKQILQNNPQIAKSFRREADLLYNLSHTNLPKVTNCFQEDNANYIVMDYISGEDLAQNLIKGKRFSVEEVVNIADKVLDALEYLHSVTIFHRDIKPHNIKIDETGKIYLLDFGTAKGTFDETTLTQNVGQSITGFTPFYAPLEQVLRVDPNSFLLLQSTDSPLLNDFLEKKTDERSDIYSLGATLYHLLTRLSPEKATATFRAFSVWTGKPDPLQNIRELNGEVSAEFANVIYRSLELDPENRFQTAAEFRNALKNMERANQTAEVVNYSTEQTVVLNTAEPILETQSVREPIPQTQMSREPVNFVAKKEVAPVSFEPIPQIETPQKSSSTGSKLAIFGTLAVLLIALIGLGGWLALRSPAEKIPNPPSAETSPRTLNYSLLVQKMRDGKKYQEPFESSGQEIFENGYEFQMRFTPPDNGYVYVFAEGLNDKNEKILNIIFPTPKRNDASASIKGNQQYETGWNKFGGTEGTENFWIIWSKDKPEIAEKSCENAFQSETGELTDKNLAGDLRNYLEKNKDSKATVSKDSEKKNTKIGFSGDATAYLIQLEHR